ncbi:MAG TPA: hypothetical protein VM366_20810 [Anaerolineae bacterium]|nr:hypothetical protein [Anaerolineae bacterium]
MAEQQSVINLEWMDQEVRRYRSELVAAQQRINAQQDEVRDLNRHIEELEGRLAAQQTQMSRINILERALEQYKEEIRLLVEQQQETYQQGRRESARIKLIEQDSTNRALNELRKSWARIPRLEEEIELRAAEERRLNETLLAVRQRTMDLEKRIDTVVRPIPYLEEQRTRDAKYIAQLQEQTASLLKSVDGMTNRLLVVEELSHRNSQNVEDLVNIRRELQERQRRFLEEMQLSDQQRERKVEQWTAADEAREQRMREFAEQMRIAAEQYQKVRSTLASLESLGERLQREQHEVAELQRLTEERQRGKMDEWESETEKRWQREKLLWEQQWHDHDRRNAEQLERLKVVEERSEVTAEQAGHLWDVIVDDLRLQNEMMQNRTIKLSEEIEARRNRKRSQ